MFSIKKLTTNSRSIALIVDEKEKKVKETIYFTELTRDMDEKIIKSNNFTKDMSQYTIISKNNEFKLKKEYLFQMTCNNNPQDSFPREIKLIIAPSNSGKSYQLANYIIRYNQAFQKNLIAYASTHSIKADKSFKPVFEKEIDIKEIDVNAMDSIIDFSEKDAHNSLFIFDDMDTNTGIVRLEDMDIDSSQLTPLQKTKAIKTAKLKSLDNDYFVNESVKNLIHNARKYRVSMAYIFHDFFNGRFENELLTETTSVILFPYNSDNTQLTKWLLQKLKMNKEQVKFINDITWFQYDFLEINKFGGKRFLLTPDTLKLF